MVRELDDLVERCGVEPVAERGVALELEPVGLPEHLAADRLHDVGVRHLRADRRSRAHAQEGLEAGEVLLEQLLDRAGAGGVVRGLGHRRAA